MLLMLSKTHADGKTIVILLDDNRVYLNILNTFYAFFAL